MSEYSKECKLEIVEYFPEMEVRVITLTADEILTIGRSAQVEGTKSWVIPFAEVSSKHAQIRYSDSGWVLKDLKSKNGTLINSMQLYSGQEYPLSNEDVICVAKYEVNFYSEISYKKIQHSH